MSVHRSRCFELKQSCCCLTKMLIASWEHSAGHWENSVQLALTRRERREGGKEDRSTFLSPLLLDLPWSPTHTHTHLLVFCCHRPKSGFFLLLLFYYFLDCDTSQRRRTRRRRRSNPLHLIIHAAAFRNSYQKLEEDALDPPHPHGKASKTCETWTFCLRNHNSPKQILILSLIRAILSPSTPSTPTLLLLLLLGVWTLELVPKCLLLSSCLIHSERFRRVCSWNTCPSGKPYGCFVTAIVRVRSRGWWKETLSL